MLRKFFRIFFTTLFSIVLILVLIILVSGRWYLFKGIANTYFKGRSGPSATEYAIFENRKILAEDPKPLPHAKLYNTSRLPSDAEAILNEFKAHAFIIVRNDSLLHEQYWDGFSDTSHTNSFSVAKTYVSVLLGCALKDGYIKSLDEPVSTYIPEFAEGAKAKITLRHLVTMTSGIDFNESYLDPFAYPAEGYYGSDLLKASCKCEATEEPGKVFRYLSGNTALLGICIARAVKKPLSDYMSGRLWKDLQCERPAFWSLDKKGGYEKAFCCINSNATDFARIGMLYLNNGKWNGRQVVDSQYVVQSVNPTDCREEDGSQNHTYGYNWWLTEYKGHKIFYARGILGQHVICVPDKHMVIVKLSRKRRPKSGLYHYPDDVGTCVEAALEMYK